MIKYFASMDPYFKKLYGINQKWFKVRYKDHPKAKELFDLTLEHGVMMIKIERLLSEMESYVEPNPKPQQPQRGFETSNRIKFKSP